MIYVRGCFPGMVKESFREILLWYMMICVKCWWRMFCCFEQSNCFFLQIYNNVVNMDKEWKTCVKKLLGLKNTCFILWTLKRLACETLFHLKVKPQKKWDGCPSHATSHLDQKVDGCPSKIGRQKYTLQCDPSGISSFHLFLFWLFNFHPLNGSFFCPQ